MSNFYEYQSIIEHLVSIDLELDSAKLRRLSSLEFKYNSDIFRFVSMRRVEIYITSLGKLII